MTDEQSLVYFYAGLAPVQGCYVVGLFIFLPITNFLLAIYMNISQAPRGVVFSVNLDPAEAKELANSLCDLDGYSDQFCFSINESAGMVKSIVFEFTQYSERVLNSICSVLSGYGNSVNPEYWYDNESLQGDTNWILGESTATPQSIPNARNKTIRRGIPFFMR